MQSLLIGLALFGSMVACGRYRPPVTEGGATPPSAAVTSSNDRNLKFDPSDTLWTDKVEKSDDEWRKILTEEEFTICRQQGTEYAFSSPLYELEETGMYYCTCCANPLFHSTTKFHSGTGWPSFWKPYASKSVGITVDRSHGMVREEVHCARCDAHLGHVFDDGPKPTGLRYCMDGVALHFEKSK